MRPRRNLTIDQQSLGIVMLQTGRSQIEVTTELGVSQSDISKFQSMDIKRLQELQKGVEVNTN